MKNLIPWTLRFLQTGRLLLAITAVILVVPGCSSTTKNAGGPTTGERGWSQWFTPTKTVAQQERSRKETAMQNAVAANREQALLTTAENRWQDGDAADAERLLLRILEETPDSLAAKRMLAEFYLATGRTKEAIGTLKELMLDDPQSPELQYHYATALEEAGFPYEANAVFQRIRRRVPEDSWLAEATQQSTLALSQQQPPSNVAQRREDFAVPGGVVPASYGQPRQQPGQQTGQQPAVGRGPN